MMDISIYQINPAKDEKGLMFAGYQEACRSNPNGAVDSSIYDMVYSGPAKAIGLEDVFAQFNLETVEGFEGNSLSVSDVVHVKSSDGEEPGFYYCDNVGFRKIDFDLEKVQDTIQVVLLEPGKCARVADIGTLLGQLQNVVDGFIEVCYPFEEEVCIVCNEEGKLNGLPLNRAIRNADNEVTDIIAGTFFICDCSGECFGSLTPQQQEKYLELFRNPERFYMKERKIEAVPYEPMAKAYTR